MHTHVHTTANLAPEVERAVRSFTERWVDAIEPLAADLEEAVRNNATTLTSIEAIRSEVSPTVGEYTADIQALFREHSRESAKAGRALAARRNELDIRFDVLPQSTIDQLDEWKTTVSDEVADTLEEDITNYLRGAAEEGLSSDAIADQFQEEFVDGRLTDWKADQLARDNTVAPANAGNHSALQDSSAIAKRWVTTLDGRQRETHEAADGQVVAVDQPFIVGGFRAQHPGDPSLPVAEFTQCRCTLAAVFESDLTMDQIQRLQAGERIQL
jgi:uncharacterized protein with gpF-like domain